MAPLSVSCLINCVDRSDFSCFFFRWEQRKHTVGLRQIAFVSKHQTPGKRSKAAFRLTSTPPPSGQRVELLQIPVLALQPAASCAFAGLGLLIVHLIVI